MSYLPTSTAENPQGTIVNTKVGGTPFKTSTPLAANASVNTGWISTAGYSSLLYVFRSNAPGSVAIEYSDDGTTAFMAGNALAYAGGSTQIQRALVPKGLYTRLTYTNGSTAQTTFRFEVKLSTTLIQPSESSLNADITGSELGMITASVAYAPDTGGSFAQVKRTGDALNVQVMNPTGATDTSLLAKDGTDGTGITPPTGGTGIRGWLSGIFQKLSGTLNVSITNSSIPVTGFPATQSISGSVSVSNFPATQVVAQPNPANATVSNVNTSGTVSTVLAANANRKGATFNSVTGTILLKLGTGASASSYSARLTTNTYYELPQPAYTGVITAIGAGTLTVTEITT